ncbi:hypothetical protein VNI00_001277 [Paramarasmius palmivorus]|uniref:FAD dependent oxidoreductase domain-containing protein n=1 Tax=Paramarasmius palmivorus TaxID=297713 RepID=A0AAW0E8U2_9AGAR
MSDSKFKDPGLPVPNPSLSFWLQGVRSSPLLGHRTTENLPNTTDVVIIGAGMSGASIAYFLLTGPNPPRSVVLLEAREARKSMFTDGGYPAYKAQFGREQAFKILQNEMDTLNLLTELVEKEGIDCDFWKRQSFDIAVSDEGADLLKRAYDEYKLDGGKMDGVVELIADADEAKKRTRTPTAVLATSFPSSTLYPYKLVAHLVNVCINSYGLNLQTSTPVLSVTRATSEDKWIVETTRGAIATHKVVYATNAWTAHLLPEYLGKIVPKRVQIGAVVPTRNYSGSRMLLSSSAWIDSLEKVDYIAQRPKDGIIIVGGRRWLIPEEDTIDQADDSVKLDIHTNYLKEILPDFLGHWGSEGPGEGMLCDWTGIATRNPDNVPYVGDLPGRPNAFICAGHVGHGMARILSCAQGLAAFIRGEEWEKTKIPEHFRPTKERLGVR